MAYSFATVDNYRRRYSTYYHVLEKDFVTTEQYISIDPDNYSSFSNEFIKLLQAICSEVDVVSKYLCKLFDPKFSGDSFPYYCKCILDKNPLFIRANVMIPKVQSIQLAPWYEWSYEDYVDKSNVSRVRSNNPEWWTKYNKVKHDRTAIDKKSGKEYYKFANQKNVLDALAALFILNSYILHFLCKEAPQNDKTVTYLLNDWYKSSRLFSGFLVANL